MSSRQCGIHEKHVPDGLTDGARKVKSTESDDWTCGKYSLPWCCLRPHFGFTSRTCHLQVPVPHQLSQSFRRYQVLLQQCQLEASRVTRVHVLCNFSELH